MRRRAAVLFTILLLLVLTGCDSRLYAPTDAGPLRYRDEVFASVAKTSNLVYGSAPDSSGTDVNLLLDVYQPVGDTVDARPAVIWVHGGGFSGGTKSSPEIVDEANTFARKGYVSVSINYRLSPTGCSASTPTTSCVDAILDAKYDAQAAVRWLRANADTYDIDTDRIAIAGTSAGAITALNVAYSPDDPGTSGTPGQPSNVRAAVSLSGAALVTPDTGEPPALLFHGTSDTTVPYAWAQNTVSQAEAAGLWVELTSWTGAGHVPFSAHRTEIIDQTTNFLYWSMWVPGAAS